MGEKERERELQASGPCSVKNKQVVLTESAQRSALKICSGSHVFQRRVSRIQQVVLTLNSKITKKGPFSIRQILEIEIE